MQTRRGSRSSGAWLRGVLLAFAIALLLLLPVASPGSGTAVNLDSSGDVAALIRADHHAKTLPSVAVAAVVLALVALVARPAQRTASPMILAPAPVLGGVDPLGRPADTGVLARAIWARRGPPAAR